MKQKILYNGLGAIEHKMKETNNYKVGVLSAGPTKYSRKAVWVHQVHKRKAKRVMSIMDWHVLDMSARMEAEMFGVPFKAPSQEWDFLAWVDEFVKERPFD